MLNPDYPRAEGTLSLADDITIRDYIDRRWEDHERLHQARHDEADAKWGDHERVHFAERQELLGKEQRLNERLEDMNEFRAEMVEDKAHFLSRELFEARLRPIERFLWAAIGLLSVAAILVPTVFYWIGPRHP